MEGALQKLERGQQRNVAAIVGGLGTAILLFIAFHDGLTKMLSDWGSPEYSHGWLIPLVALYMGLKSAGRVALAPRGGCWWGPALVGLSLAFLALGELSTLYIVTQYAFLMALGGLAVSLLGVRRTLLLWAPLAFLLFMVPLPNFLYYNLSSQLQLISSSLGVAVIRALGIPVFLEGNVIDLGVYKLQVAEACSGLRYLFPLMSFGFLMAFLYRGAVWKKLLLFFSTIPIAILMNSLRIGVIGGLVEYQGIQAAEGFVHLFEGWIVFLVCLAILTAEAAILHRLGRGSQGGAASGLRDALDIDMPWKGLAVLKRWEPSKAGAFAAALIVLGVGVGASLSLGGRSEMPPARATFSSFPLQIEGWHGRDVGLDPDILSALKLDDYINADFVDSGRGDVVNFYVAYYASQRKGASAHSPRSCIPGGGWEIESLTETRVYNVGFDPEGLPVNRVVISKGGSRQLVYYWFQQRGRIITNEYLVKWYLLVDAILRNRTDGAMVRLVTPIHEGEDPAVGDEILKNFLHDMAPDLGRFIPN